MATQVFTRVSTDEPTTADQISQGRLVATQSKLNVDSSTKYFNDFTISENKITFSQPFTSIYSQLLIEEPIPKNCVYHLKWRILNSKKNAIFVGIKSTTISKNYRASHVFKHAFSYFGKKALVWPGKVRSGTGFGEGDEIQIILDRPNHTIQWRVNGIKAARINHLALTNFEFVPFVQMVDQNDTIEWMGSWTQ